MKRYLDLWSTHWSSSSLCGFFVSVVWTFFFGFIFPTIKITAAVSPKEVLFLKQYFNHITDVHVFILQNRVKHPLKLKYMWLSEALISLLLLGSYYCGNAVSIQSCFLRVGAMDQQLIASKPVLPFQRTQVWCSTPMLVSSHLPVTPAPGGIWCPSLASTGINNHMHMKPIYPIKNRTLFKKL